GCETLEKLNPFEEKKIPITGDRRAVFPTGVPGVAYDAPPQQPSNSNVPVTSSIGAADDNKPVTAQTQPAQTTNTRSAKTAPAPKQTPPVRSAVKPSSDTEDPWGGAR